MYAHEIVCNLSQPIFEKIKAPMVRDMFCSGNRTLELKRDQTIKELDKTTIQKSRLFDKKLKIYIGCPKSFATFFLLHIFG